MKHGVNVRNETNAEHIAPGLITSALLEVDFPGAFATLNPDQSEFMINRFKGNHERVPNNWWIEALRVRAINAFENNKYLTKVDWPRI